MPLVKFATEFTVKRSEWGFGSKVQDEEGSRLLRSDGLKCCIGFYCLASGLTEDEIRGKTVLATEDGTGDAEDVIALHGMEALRQSEKMGLFAIIYNTNDRSVVEDREEIIATRLAQAGITVTFVD